ncbi:MAG: hypothetical protein M1837_000849 [Sclerophora amabilis]|nr:MAG: hypothetical protein M1837_000849 [Sclerophora amabilis]
MAVADEESGTAGRVNTGSNEESPLLAANRRPRQGALDRPSSATGSGNDLPTPEDHEKQPRVAGVICLLLIGVLIANADGSLVMATYGTISSDFNQLEDGSWLTTAYILAMCASQPITGKLSDVFGRKEVLLSSYSLFAIGSLICGLGQTMWQVIFGRAVAGIGGAGMTVIVSILITDMVPVIEIAAWRSYVNVVATVGRSVGGPLGGFLADTIGWRWSFIGQAPLTALAFILVAIGLKPPASGSEIILQKTKLLTRLRRIDFLGAMLIAGAVVTFLLALDLGGQRLPWSSPVVIVLAAVSPVLATGFLFYEGRFARDPIFPPRLLVKRDVATSYALASLQVAAQFAMMFSVPLYFQVTQGVSNTKAGFHLLPAVLGNTVGGLLAGYCITRTGRYKVITSFATVSAAVAYILLILRWHGHTNAIESLYIIPGGFGTGIANAASFIALTANLDAADMAVATSGMYLATNIGMLVGVCTSSSVNQSVLRMLLHKRLQMPGAEKMLEDALSNVSSIWRLKGAVRDVFIRSYVESLEYSHVSLAVKEHPIK